MPRHALQTALEGEIVEVKGMFVGLPVKIGERSTLKALEELDDVIEALDTEGRITGVYQFLSADTPGAVTAASPSMALEAATTFVQKIKKVIAAALAALITLMQTLIRWLLGGFKRRGLHKEALRIFEESFLRFEKLFSGERPTYSEIIQIAVKIDKTNEKWGAKCTAIQADALEDGPYVKAMRNVIDALAKTDLSNYIKGLGKSIGQTYAGLVSEAKKVDAQGKPEVDRGSGTDLINREDRGELAKYQEKVDKEMGAHAEEGEHVIKNLADGIADARNTIGSFDEPSSNYKFDPDLYHMIARVHRVPSEVGYVVASRFRPEYGKILVESEKSIQSAERRFKDTAGADLNPEDGKKRAEAYLDRAALEAIREFGKVLQTVANGIALMERHFDAVVDLSILVQEYAIDCLERFKADHKDQYHSHVVSKLADLRFNLNYLKDELRKAYKFRADPGF